MIVHLEAAASELAPVPVGVLKLEGLGCKLVVVEAGIQGDTEVHRDFIGRELLGRDVLVDGP